MLMSMDYFQQGTMRTCAHMKAHRFLHVGHVGSCMMVPMGVICPYATMHEY